MPGDPRLLLVGSGHSNNFVLAALAAGGFPPVRPVLVTAAEEYYYSGMIPGVIAGNYEPGQARLLPRKLAAVAGTEFILAKVVRIDAARRVVETADGRALEYDLLSVATGSALSGGSIPGLKENAVPVKPMAEALGLMGRARRAVESVPAGAPATVVIVGGGAAGVEIAFCLDASLRQRFGPGRHAITIIDAGAQILTGYLDRLRQRAEGLLRGRGIIVRTGSALTRAETGRVYTTDGPDLPCDVLVWATGPAATPLFRDSGLPTDPQGYLDVTPTLQCRAHPEIFGAGDCISIAEFPWMSRAGVYAVREGPVLAGNLARRLRGEPPVPYAPQKDWLSLLNTGDGRALIQFRGYTGHGRLFWWLKDRIDLKFMRRFQGMQERTAAPRAA